MDAALFAQMLSDKKVTNLKKLGYKYPRQIFLNLLSC